MSLMNALFGGELGNPVEDGKKAQIDLARRFNEQQRIWDERFKDDFIEGECSVVEIDGKKLIEEIK